MSSAATCAESSLAAGEPLAGTATRGARWLLVELRGAWGRDAVPDTELSRSVRAALESFPGKVILVRRPDRRSGVTVIEAIVEEGGGTAVRQELDSLEALPEADLGGGDPEPGPIVLVCAHGRRDACCARLGPPLFDALAPHVAPGQLWQSSHLGGHRFAPNVLVLPLGIQLGRVPVERAGGVLDLLADGRIPLDLYRGRTLYPAPVQAAEVALRVATGCDGVGALRFVAHEGNLVTFATPDAVHGVRVEERPGPVLPASCGAEPEPMAAWAASPIV